VASPAGFEPATGRLEGGCSDPLSYGDPRDRILPTRATLARADARLASVPIIVGSADVTALRDRAPELERVGNVHLLNKPFTIDEITTLVESLVGRAAPASG
jgi:hypothetical protein